MKSITLRNHLKFLTPVVVVLALLLCTASGKAQAQSAVGDSYVLQSTELENEWIHAMGRVLRQSNPTNMRIVLDELIMVNGAKPEKVNILYYAGEPESGLYQRTILKNILDNIKVPYEEFAIEDNELTRFAKEEYAKQKLVPNFDVNREGELRTMSSFGLISRDLKEAAASFKKGFKNPSEIFKSPAGTNAMAGIATTVARLGLAPTREFWFSTIQQPIWATLGMFTVSSIAGVTLLLKNAMAEWMARSEIDLLKQKGNGRPISKKELYLAKASYYSKFLTPYIIIAFGTKFLLATNPEIDLNWELMWDALKTTAFYFSLEVAFFRLRNKLQFLTEYIDKNGVKRAIGGNLHMTLTSLTFGYIEFYLMLQHMAQESATRIMEISPAGLAVAVSIGTTAYLWLYDKIKRKRLAKEGIVVRDLKSHHSPELPRCKGYLYSLLAI